MSLTGPVFFALVVLLTLAGFAAVVWWWPRWSGRGVRTVAARVGMLAGVNLLVLLTAAVGMNDQFIFFADWTDLAGSLGAGQSYTTAQAGGNARAAAAAPVGTGLPSLLPALPTALTPGDRVLHYTVIGPLSGVRGALEVELPPGYTDPVNRTRRYPVLIALQGYPGGPSSWIDSMDIGGALQTAVAAHRIGQAIVIAPSTEIPPGRDTECVDGLGSSPRVETWLTRDLPAWAAHTFRVRTDRASWAAIGLSAGGWCAAMAAMLHPDRFAAAIVLGGYFQPQFGPLYTPFTSTTPAWRRYNLIALAAHHPPAVALWLETSHADPTSYPTSAQLLKAAHSPLSVQSLVLAHAGHRASLWQGLLPRALAWLGATIPGFAPSHG